MNDKKEGEYYSQMVRRYKTEYGGENLQEFCIKEKVSYTKMLHCLRNESYRRSRQQAKAQVEDPGLRRGSGLKKICNATKALETYKEGRDPVFKSSVSQFMTVIYSMEYVEGTTKKTTEKTTEKILSLISENPNVTAMRVLCLASEE